MLPNIFVEACTFAYATAHETADKKDARDAKRGER